MVISGQFGGGIWRLHKAIVEEKFCQSSQAGVGQAREYLPPVICIVKLPNHAYFATKKVIFHVSSAWISVMFRETVQEGIYVGIVR